MNCRFDHTIIPLVTAKITNQQNTDNPSVLHQLVQSQDLAGVLQLIKKNRKIKDEINSNGSYAIHFGCIKGDFNIVINLVVYARSSISCANKAGLTPLHCACQSGNMELVEWLVTNGAGLEAVCQKGKTPLHYACARGHLNIVKLLQSKVRFLFLITILVLTSVIVIRRT